MAAMPRRLHRARRSCRRFVGKLTYEKAITAPLFAFRIAGARRGSLHFSRGRRLSMKIHEYQAKEILRKYGVPVPGGEMVQTLEEADRAAKNLFDKGNAVVVVKAQIHA